MCQAGRDAASLEGWLHGAASLKAGSTDTQIGERDGPGRHSEQPGPFVFLREDYVRAEEIQDEAARLAAQTPREVLEWASERFGARVTLATAFGAEGCVLVDIIGRHQLAIDLFTIDTGLLFPETYELWRRLERRYGIRIRAVQPALSVEAQEVRCGPRLWERDPDRCCAIRKVAPLARALEGFDAWITGIRREQTAARRTAEVVEWDARAARIKINPLVRWSDRDVWSHLAAHEVPYNPLYERGYSSIGCVPCTTPVVEGEDPRAGRWREREKTECGLHGPPTPGFGAEAR